MRSYSVYGIQKGGSEQWIENVHSPAEGKRVHERMKAQGVFDEIVVRDCLGGLRFRKSLSGS